MACMTALPVPFWSTKGLWVLEFLLLNKPARKEGDGNTKRQTFPSLKEEGSYPKEVERSRRAIFDRLVASLVRLSSRWP